MKKGLAAFGGILLLLIIIVMAGYNGLAGSREDVASAAANVDTMLQRRSDLIPNLIDSVKSYAAHETAVFTDASGICKDIETNGTVLCQ